MPLRGIPGIMTARGGTPSAVEGFQYKRSLTIDATLVPSTQTDFPVLVSFTDTTFKTVGNGGHVENANGYDIVFFSDSGLTTPLDFEIEFYDGANGIIVMWVLISSVDGSTDTIFYMGYGDSAINTSQENVAAVWANYTGVYHLPNGASLNVDDVAGGHDGTNNSATATAGMIDGGAAFSGSSQYIALPSTADWNFGTGDYTVSCWFYVDSVALGYQILIGKDTDTNRQWTLGVNPFGDADVGFFSFPAALGVFSDPSSISDDTWYLVHATRSGTTLSIYLDSVMDATQQTDASNYTGTGQIWLGARQYPGFPQYLDGSMDEVRILVGTVLSADWITTEYNNQSDPTVFIDLGTETAP